MRMEWSTLILVLIASGVASAIDHPRTVTVDCSHHNGTSDTAFATIGAALTGTEHAPAAVQIRIAPGATCHLDAPLKLTDATHPNGVSLTGGPGPGSVISGGQPVTGWKPVSWAGAPKGAVYGADVSSWPIEIKTLRHATVRVSRSRFPFLDADGLGSKNWLFATSW